MVLACLATTSLLPPDYNRGGGAVALIAIVTYLLFRFVIELLLNRVQKKRRAAQMQRRAYRGEPESRQAAEG
jgi:hypothetical protein